MIEDFHTNTKRMLDRLHFNKEKQRVSDKEINFTVFAMDNNLSDKEVEYVRLWMQINKRKPDELKMPNGDLKQLSWSKML